MTKLKFDPGTILSTYNARDLVLDAKVAGQPYINRHLRGDFGEIDSALRRQNKTNIELKGGIVKSQYLLPNGTTLEIQTEFNRGFTIFCLPGEDYSDILRRAAIEQAATKENVI